MTVDEILDAEDILSLEGERGVEALNAVAKHLGYTEQPFKFGSSLELMLADNSGLAEAMIEWIDDNLFEDEEDEDEDLDP